MHTVQCWPQKDEMLPRGREQGWTGGGKLESFTFFAAKHPNLLGFSFPFQVNPFSNRWPLTVGHLGRLFVFAMEGGRG